MLQPSRRLIQSGSRSISSTCVVYSHENPLGLPRSGAPPTMPRMQRGLPTRRSIPGCKKVLVVSSGKGGVGKSSIAVNLALSLAQRRNESGERLRIGLLDLDIFGPSIPKLMKLEGVGEPLLSRENRLIPLRSYSIPCMSMGFLLPNSPSASSNADTPVVWRGMMVMKAVQQLLFDVDWRAGGPAASGIEEEIDVLVIDTPPGTGDVALSLGQLVKVDGAVVVSTPQDVAIIDTRKGIAMFKKIGIPIIGSILNMSHFSLPTLSSSSPPIKSYIFGPPTSFETMCSDLSIPILGVLPLDPTISEQGDRGRPIVLSSSLSEEESSTGSSKESIEAFNQIAATVWQRLHSSE